MGNLQQQRLRIGIVFATIALTALLLAQGTTGLLAAALLDTGSAEAMDAPAAPRSLRSAAAVETRSDARTILARNIFDSTQGDLTASPVAVASDVGEQEAVAMLDPNAPPPRCDGSMRLVGAVVHATRPEWSFASIAGAAGKAMLYRAGMSIDGRELVAIGADRVYLRPSGSNVCTLDMFGVEGAPVAAQPQPQAVAVAESPATGDAPVAGGDGAISAADMDSNIQRVSDTQYNINRGLVNQLLENQAELMRTARIIPHEEGGRTVGVKLYGIRRNALLGRLGLQNGDMLRTINGFDMTSPDSALEAYARLRNADNLTVSVVRRGQPMTINYNIR